MNDTVFFCVRYVDTGPHPHPSSCVASNICSHGRDMEQASVHICSHERDMLHCIMLQPCVQLEKSEHPHPNLDCLSSTYPGKKIRAALTWPWARAGSAGPRGPHPYSPYPRGIRSGPRARTTGAPNPERARGRDNEKEMKGKWDRMLLTLTGADIASPPLSKEKGSLNVGFWDVKM